MKIKVGIVGGKGYTAWELICWLQRHPNAELILISSRTEAGKLISARNPQFSGNLKFSDFDIEQFKKCDCVFFATPNGVAMHSVDQLLQAGVKVIDLSADFRLNNQKEWNQFYNLDHAAWHLMDKAVYGLCEMNREKIKQAQLIANPGCYATTLSLALWPLLQLPEAKNYLNLQYIHADGKSGTSGAGRTVKENFLYCEVNENLSAYQISGHRHQVEVKEHLTKNSRLDFNFSFVPHLIPMQKGILMSVYIPLIKTGFNWQKYFNDFYQNESFIKVLEAGKVQTKNVVNTNQCHISVEPNIWQDTLIIHSSLDNMAKGASTQAIQNMNLMFGLQEGAGLI